MPLPGCSLMSMFKLSCWYGLAVAKKGVAKKKNKKEAERTFKLALGLAVSSDS